MGEDGGEQGGKEVEGREVWRKVEALGTAKRWKNMFVISRHIRGEAAVEEWREGEGMMESLLNVCLFIRPSVCLSKFFSSFTYSCLCTCLFFISIDFCFSFSFLYSLPICLSLCVSFFFF